MKHKYKILILLVCLPAMLGGVWGVRYGPWWGMREQNAVPDTPNNGVKIYADASNNLHSLHETGDTSKLNLINSSGQLEIDEYAIHTGDADTAWRFRSDRVTLYAGGRTMMDAVEIGANTYLYVGYDGANAIDVSIGPNAAIAIEATDGVVTLQNVLRTATSKWYYCKYIDAISVSAGGSGASLTVPTANTIGGYKLDAAGEYLYFDARTCSNWDAASDLIVKITFEVNVDNSGGNAGDTVDLSLLSYFKGDGDTSCKSQTIETANTIGTSAQYKQFTSNHTIDYDDPNNTVDTNDVFAFRINLETDTSEVDDIVINFIIFTYQTKQVHVEI